MIAYKPKHFQLYELVPKWTYETAPHHKLWMCWRPEILWTADRLRDLYGTVNVNTWWWGGSTQYRGWRPQKPTPGQKWAEWTQHAWWNALDMVFKYVSAEEVRQDIKANKWPVEFQHIRGLEDKIPWVHIDCRNAAELMVFTP